MITIYHNPRCSKSREALQIIQDFAAQQDLTVDIIEYLKTPPDSAGLHSLCQQLAQSTAQTYGDALKSMVRDGEPEFAARQLAQADAAGLLAALAAEPRLLQRPIIVYRQQARIARPVEGLAQWLLEIKGQNHSSN